MRVRSFFDTNVLLYADDEFAPAKQRCSRDLVAQHRRDGTGVVSLQVLQEYFVNVTRKLHVDPRIARRKVEMLAEFPMFWRTMPHGCRTESGFWWPVETSSPLLQRTVVIPTGC